MKESETDPSLTESSPAPEKSMNLKRRNFLKTGLWAGTFETLGMTYHKAVAENSVAEAAEKNIDNKMLEYLNELENEVEKATRIIEKMREIQNYETKEYLGDSKMINID